jgi:hypothetical protein
MPSDRPVQPSPDAVEPNQHHTLMLGVLSGPDLFRRRILALGCDQTTQTYPALFLGRTVPSR